MAETVAGRVAEPVLPPLSCPLPRPSLPRLALPRRAAVLLLAALALPQPLWAETPPADPFAAAVAAAAAGRHGVAAAGFHGLAQAGDAEAAYNLALLFMTGQGVPQNHTEAAYWAWQARLGGLRRARLLLDRLTPHLDRPRQQTVAARLEAALGPQAEAGDGAAMLALAAVLGHVRPAPDPLQAHAWQSIAAALDVPGSLAARDASWQAMDPANRAEAEAVALTAFRDWCGRRGAEAPPPCRVVLP
jgi:uncharacterized protein